MSQSTQTDHLKPFMEATIASSARFRRVLIVVIVSSVLAFSAFWNARPGSWLNSRFEVTRTAHSVQAREETAAELARRERELKEITKTMTAETSAGDKAALLKDQFRLNEETQRLSQKLQELDTYLASRDVETAKQWITRNGITSSGQIEMLSEPLVRARTNHVVLIHIPFFGTAFDVNELGLIGGFTFVVVLMWFRFTLWREYYNLCSTFEACGNNQQDFEACYKYLAMNQVLTVPPTLFTREPRERPWGKIVRLLYLLPVLVQLAVVVNDCLTFHNGWLISKPNTIVSIAASVCFLALAALLTYWCFRLSAEIDREWDAAHARLKNPEVLARCA
jgi:hypothetical protein